MVKEFLKCNSIKERTQFLVDTVFRGWDAGELDMVMDIMGLSREGMEAPENKINAIEEYLAGYKHEVETRGGVDGPEVDSIPVKDQASTLFEGPSEAEVVSKMLNPFSKERQAQPNFQIVRLAFQHIAAMIVGCVAPSIIIAGVAGLHGEDRIIIVRAASMVSALAAFLRVFSAGFRKDNLQSGAGLPLIVGGGFVTLCGNWVAGHHQFPAGHEGRDRRHGRDGLGSHG